MAKSEPKQVIVIRKDLNMRRGKQIAQGAHASLGAILNYDLSQPSKLPKPVQEWLNGRFAKICVYVNSEQELLEIYNAAIQTKVNVKLIKDAGLTEFGGVHTLTCLAIGPDYPEQIDPITGALKLL